MTQLVTRCPQCSTSFRITPAQIQKARGAVRCGSCLHIFNAEQNLIEGRSPKPVERREKPTKRAPQTPPPTQTQLPINSEPDTAAPAVTAPKQPVAPIFKTPEPTTAKPQRADAGDIRRDPAASPKPAAATAKPGNHQQNAPSPTAPTRAGSSDPTPEAPPKPTPAPAVKPGNSINKSEPDIKPSATPEGLLRFDQAQIDLESELDDDALISDDMHNPAPKTDSDLYLAPSDSGHSLFERKIERRNEEFVDTSDESWAENLLEDHAPAPQQSGSAFDNPLSVTRDDGAVSVGPAESGDSAGAGADEFIDDYQYNSDYTENAELAEPSSDTDPAAAARPAPNPRFHLRADRSDANEDDRDENDQQPAEFQEHLHAYDSERSALLLGIDPEPLEMARAHHRPWRKRLLWGGLCLLAVIALAAQIAWLQFDRYSRIEPYRGYYQSVCDITGCQLPTLRDTSKVRAFNLVVRQHPEHANALMVDAIILNGAEFEQPYPALQLTFSNINNKPVASRLFTPKEYLRGELTGRTIMPSNQPVHLSLELSDPGPDAVNYSLVIP